MFLILLLMYRADGNRISPNIDMLSLLKKMFAKSWRMPPLIDSVFVVLNIYLLFCVALWPFLTSYGCMALLPFSTCLYYFL